MDLSIGGVDHQALVIPLDDNDTHAHRRRIAPLAGRAHWPPSIACATHCIVLAVLSLLLSIIGSVAVARNITRPLEALAGAAARIEQGDYGVPVKVRRADEIGVLASSLNHMRGSIAEREHRILKLAYEDPLTDLANRSRFSNELARAIGDAVTGKYKLSHPHDGSRPFQIRQRHARTWRGRSRAARGEPAAGTSRDQRGLHCPAGRRRVRHPAQVLQ